MNQQRDDHAEIPGEFTPAKWTLAALVNHGDHRHHEQPGQNPEINGQPAQAYQVDDCNQAELDHGAEIITRKCLGKFIIGQDPTNPSALWRHMVETWPAQRGRADRSGLQANAIAIITLWRIPPDN